nr:MAG: methyltransferase domain-containing protein [Hyphomicrobiales bacterium]
MTDTPPNIFDRSVYRAHRRRALHANNESFLADLAISALSERAALISRRFTRALNLGSHGTFPKDLVRLAKNWTYAAPALSKGHNYACAVADEEALPFADESFDLIVSALSLHAVNDLPGALLQIRRALKPDGLFMAAMFGGETLRELRISFAGAETKLCGGVFPRVSPFADLRDLGGLLQRAGFALPVTDVERSTARYKDIGKLFSDLRAIGETNALSQRTRTPLTRRLLDAVAAGYAERFCVEDNRLPATFEIIFLTGWAPHESQPKPLRPGSAKMRLADALGTEERPAGEKPPGRTR